MEENTGVNLCNPILKCGTKVPVIKEKNNILDFSKIKNFLCQRKIDKKVKIKKVKR